MSDFHRPWSPEMAADPLFRAAKIKLWQNSFYDWAMDCVYTTDESDLQNPVKPFPNFKYLYELDKVEQEAKILDIVKARRMMVSHYSHAKTLWSFLFRPFSKNLMISKRENDVQDAIRNRILAAYYRLPMEFECHPKLEMRKHIHAMEILHPDREFGSHILGLPSGADQIRSYTATRVVLDEFAFFERKDQQYILDAVKPAIYGGGQAVIISTPNPDTTFQDLVTEMNPDVPIRNVMQGFNVGQNKLNHVVAFLHYSAHPHQRSPEWLHRERYGTTVEGVPIPGCSGVDTYTWLREYELSFDFPLGDPVVPEFNKELHCNSYAKHGKVLPEKALDIGIDFGSRFPAAVFMQRDSLNRLIIHDGLLCENENLDKFLDRVANFIETRFEEVDTVNLYCDPAGGSRNSQGTAPPAVEIIYNKFKKMPKYRMSHPSDRARGIRKQAAELVGDAPGIIVNPLAGRYLSPTGKEETGIIPKAFDIGWVYDDKKPGKLDPKKDDFFDHLMDALGYAFIYLYPNLVETIGPLKRKKINPRDRKGRKRILRR